jgi:hypothetical protein
MRFVQVSANTHRGKCQSWNMRRKPDQAEIRTRLEVYSKRKKVHVNKTAFNRASEARLGKQQTQLPQVRRFPQEAGRHAQRGRPETRVDGGGE